MQVKKEMMEPDEDWEEGYHVHSTNTVTIRRMGPITNEMRTTTMMLEKKISGEKVYIFSMTCTHFFPF